MNLFGISINHNTAPIEVREALHLNDNEVRDFVPILKENILKEGFILSTCNRTEIFGFPKHSAINHVDIQKALIDFKPVSGVTTQSFLNFFSCSAIKHIFNVAAGIDSLMLGDSQILAQSKAAFQVADELGFTATLMRRVFSSAARVGKRAINETGIGEGAVTISYAAVQLVEKIFATLPEKKALVIGAGETSELSVTNLLDKGLTDITITNRTLAKAETLAKKFDLAVLDFENFKEHLSEFDIIISATSANNSIVLFDDIKIAMKKRNNTPMAILDIAIPRDIDNSVSDIDNVFYHDIDSLNIIVEQNLSRRKKEIPHVEKIITEEMVTLFNWYNTLEVVPVIKDLRNYFEELRQDELKKIKNKICDEDFEKIENMTRRLLGRLLHNPTVKLKEVAETGTQEQDVAAYSLILKDLYKIEDRNNGKN